MNGYVCLYNGRRIEVRANSSYQAQQLAAGILRVKPNKHHMISVVLVEKPKSDGVAETVEHTAVD